MEATEAYPSPLPAIRLAVIIPVYGNWEDTLDCLRMLAGQSSGEFRVFLSDDGSPQSPPDEVSSFRFVTYLRNPHAGFAAACNAGARAACDSGYTHLLLLNNDTAFEAGFIEAWLSKVCAFPRAIMGPIIYFYDQPGVVWYSGGPDSIAVPFFRFTRRFASQTAVDVLTACVLLVPTDIWRKCDGFDERFVTYYEDFDFMLRAREMGVAAYVVVEPSLKVLHKASRTTLSRGQWHRDYRMIASRLLFIRRRYAGIERMMCLCLAIPHLAMIMLANLPSLPNPRLLWNAVREGLTATGMRHDWRRSDCSTKTIGASVTGCPPQPGSRNHS